MKPLLLKFRVYPQRDRRRYFRVLVFRNRNTMRAFFAEQTKIIEFRLHRSGLDASDKALDFNAITTGWTAYHKQDRKWVKDERDIGQILFCQEHVRIGVVTHEMTHAGLFWARREKFSGRSVLNSVRGGQDEQHEAICWAVGNMTRQFWNRWMRYRERTKGDV